ncbi:MAG: L-histidine N(alpha)-methyltransferase, partial [Phormidesmis sp.]
LQPRECEQFLAKVNDVLKPDDYFLLGLDLQKETSLLEAAYNDSQGITAAFNLNMLQHLNRRFNGDFDITQFSHRAAYDPNKAQIEMYLKSLKAQTVHLQALDFTVHFEQDEYLLSEISRKFDLQKISQVLNKHRLPVLKMFTDQSRWFGLLLCQRT